MLLKIAMVCCEFQYATRTNTIISLETHLMRFKQNALFTNGMDSSSRIGGFKPYKTIRGVSNQAITPNSTVCCMAIVKSAHTNGNSCG